MLIVAGATKLELAAGDVNDTLGGVFGGVTVTVMADDVVVAPSASVATAVNV
jgi:predicted sugar kinase